jgi:PAS domain S-box-containing protein
MVDGTRIGPAIGSCGTAAHERRQVIASDIATDPNWARYHRLPLSLELRACWSTPVITRGDEVLGTFAVYYRETREPTPHELYLVARATHLAGIAINRTRTRTSLVGNLRFLRVLIDTIPNPVFFKNSAGAYLGCNRAFSSSMGLAEHAIVGKTVFDLAPPELAERYVAADRELFEARGIQVYEAPVRFADGSVRQIIFHKATFDDQSGAIAGLVGVMLDITAVREAEKALRESEERFREIFEQNEDAIILLARENLDLIDANPAAEKLFGRTREELVKLGPWPFVAPEDYGTLIGAIPAPGEAAPFHLDRIGAIRHDGNAIIASLWGKVVRLRSEEVVYCSIRDITDRIRMEEETRATQARLIHANKMTSLGVLVSGIAHEINNPNTFIQGNASLLDKIWLDVLPLLAKHREENGDFSLGGLPFADMEKAVPRLLFGLKEGSRRISAIIGNLKDFAREDTATGHTPIDVAAIVRDATLILSHHIHRHTDLFRLEIPEDLPRVLGKTQQVEQVVINLVMNALQALPGKEAGITVSAQANRAASAVVITVRDEGEGMTPEVMGRLTEPFFSTRLDRGGTGLGLSICASIVREHNGSLQFESSPGRGTTVTVTLPMAQPPANSPSDYAGNAYEVQR